MGTEVKVMISFFFLLGIDVDHDMLHANSFHATCITKLFLALYSISVKSNAPNTQEIILMSITQSQAVLHTLISSAHVFFEVINLKSPNKDARQQPWLPRLKVTLL